MIFTRRIANFFVSILILTSAPIAAQPSFFVPRNFQAAVEKGTRTMEGRPGDTYWQNRGVYAIDVTVAPRDGLVTGQATIRYFNESPDTLSRLNLKLFQNVHLPMAARAGRTDEAFLTDGLFIDAIKAQGQDVEWNNEAVHRSSDQTNAWLDLPAALPPGGNVELELNWHYTLQQSVRDHREGKVDSTSLFCAYWYPRISVYDDIDGWDRVRLNNQVEFYNDFNDYEVTIRVPENYLVWATGELQNAAEVLAKPYLARLNQSATSDAIVNIVTAEDLNKGGITRTAGQLAWRFRANEVTDFAFGVSDHFLWDATSLVVDSTSGERVSIQTAYLPASTDFPEVAQIARECVHYFSTQKPGIPYPYPTLSIFNGHGQMEYPMMVNDNEMNNLDDTKALTAHEIAHTYFPFLTGTNESTFAWMDEGWATLLEYFACTEHYTLENPEQAIYPGYYLRRYRLNSGPETEVPIFTPSHQLIGTAYGLNSYGKPAAALLSLQYLLGEETFRQCTRGFVERWRGKHPSPFDFFFTYEDLSGQDLDWFWQRWFMEYSTMDLAITGYRQSGEAGYVTVRNIGGKPLPIVLDIEHDDGSTRQFIFSPELWKEKHEVEVAIACPGEIKSIRLNWEQFADVNQENDQWSSGK